MEVREKVSQDKDASRDPNAPGWLAWLRTNNIPESTARSLMRLAGDTPEQRQERKAKDAERRRMDGRQATVGSTNSRVD